MILWTEWIYICHHTYLYQSCRLIMCNISFREGNGTPLQYSCLENPMDGGAWWAAVHWVARSRIWLSNFTSTFYFHTLEKEMATHSSVLALRIPGTGEPGGLCLWGRTGSDMTEVTAAAAATLISNYKESNSNCKAKCELVNSGKKFKLIKFGIFPINQSCLWKTV